ncbi:hypothetical protein ACMFMF_002992 [Clarireedia jacksonii]
MRVWRVGARRVEASLFPFLLELILVMAKGSKFYYVVAVVMFMMVWGWGLGGRKISIVSRVRWTDGWWEFCFLLFAWEVLGCCLGGGLRFVGEGGGGDGGPRGRRGRGEWNGEGKGKGKGRGEERGS